LRKQLLAAALIFAALVVSAVPLYALLSDPGSEVSSVGQDLPFRVKSDLEMRGGVGGWVVSGGLKWHQSSSKRRTETSEPVSPRRNVMAVQTQSHLLR
jgi:hypothetical protein